MKKIIKYLFLALFAGFTMVSCYGAQYKMWHE